MLATLCFSIIPLELSFRISIKAPLGIIFALASSKSSVAFIAFIFFGNSNMPGLPTNPETATVKPMSFICILVAL